MTCGSEELSESIKMKKDYLEKLLPAASMTVENIFEQPEKQYSDACRYCPMCEVEFMEEVTTCPDCNINLKSYKQ